MVEIQAANNIFNTCAISADKIVMTVEKITEMKIETSQKILNDFLYHVIKDTLVSESPESIFKYDIPMLFDSKDIVHILDSMLYTIFNKNIYAIPYVSFHNSRDIQNVSNDVIINATDTIVTINNSDKRIERILRSTMSKDIGKLTKGESIEFTGLSSSLFELPMVYAKSRAKYILEELKRNNYSCEFNEHTGYISISCTEEKQ